MKITHDKLLGESSKAPESELEGMTGVRCGPLSGYGFLYRIVRANGAWVVTRLGDWAS